MSISNSSGCDFVSDKAMPIVAAFADILQYVTDQSG